MSFYDFDAEEPDVWEVDDVDNWGLDAGTDSVRAVDDLKSALVASIRPSNTTADILVSILLLSLDVPNPRDVLLDYLIATEELVAERTGAEPGVKARLTANSAASRDASWIALSLQRRLNDLLGLVQNGAVR